VQELFLNRVASYRRAHVRVCLQRTSVESAAEAVASVLTVDHPHGGELAVDDLRRQEGG